MNAIVTFALRRRALMVVLLALTLGAGIVSFIKPNIEAYPDPVPPLLDFVTQSTSQPAEEIERYIPHTTTVRTISLFGLSDVKVPAARWTATSARLRRRRLRAMRASRLRARRHWPMPPAQRSVQGLDIPGQCWTQYAHDPRTDFLDSSLWEAGA